MRELEVTVQLHTVWKNLSPSTKYEFRVKAFGFDDGTPIYSDYVNVTGKTKPSMVTA